MSRPQFKFHGTIESSKSLFNRALIVQSFFPDLNIHGHSTAQDVKDLEQAIKKLVHFSHITNLQNIEHWVGEGGTVLRFLLARLSREYGTFHIRGTSRLLQRPHNGLISTLSQLGVRIELQSDRILVNSTGWTIPHRPIRLPFEQSSQYASALILSCWKLPQPITFDLSMFKKEKTPSAQYFLMTLSLLKTLGMNIIQTEDHLSIYPSWELKKNDIFIEPDWSSLATLIVAAWLGGYIDLNLEHNETPLQPDARILHIFGTQSHSSILWRANRLIVSLLSEIPAFDWDFTQNPDLLPVLSVLASFASGPCRFSGWEQVRQKESDRLFNSQKLLTRAGVPHQMMKNQWIILGQGPSFHPKTFSFDPDQDHRMAMAAGLFKLKNSMITVDNPDVVKKSFPQFWTILFDSRE